MKKLSVCLMIWAFSISVMSQIIEPQAITASGNTFSSSNVVLTYSIGEIATETYKTSSLMLSQGFIQPEINVETGYTDPEISVDFKVYPVPATSYVFIESEEVRENMVVELYNISGSKLLTAQITENKMQIDLKNLPASEYQLNIISSGQKKLIKSYKIVKF